MSIRKELRGCRFDHFSEAVDYVRIRGLLNGNHTPHEHAGCGYFIRNDYFTSEIFLELFNGN